MIHQWSAWSKSTRSLFLPSWSVIVLTVSTCRGRCHRFDEDAKKLVKEFDAKKKKLLRLIDDLNEADAVKRLRDLQQENVLPPPKKKSKRLRDCDAPVPPCTGAGCGGDLANECVGRREVCGGSLGWECVWQRHTQPRNRLTAWPGVGAGSCDR